MSELRKVLQAAKIYYAYQKANNEFSKSVTRNFIN